MCSVKALLSVHPTQDDIIDFAVDKGRGPFTYAEIMQHAKGLVLKRCNVRVSDLPSGHFLLHLPSEDDGDNGFGHTVRVTVEVGCVIVEMFFILVLTFGCVWSVLACRMLLPVKAEHNILT